MIITLYNIDLTSDKAIIMYAFLYFQQNTVPEDDLLLGRNMLH
jgi:hypothetical protein